MVKKKVTFTLSQETIEQLDQYAKEHMAVKSQIVERALQEFMKKEQ